MSLGFKPFFINEQVIRQYVEWFSRKKHQAILYDATPKSRAEVEAWTTACVEDPQLRYFFVYKSDKLIGHIGLRGINRKLNYAEVGSFFVDRRYRYGKVMEESLRFLIKEAEKMGLLLLAADFTAESQEPIGAFLKVGFTRVPTAPHYLTLKLDRTSRL